MKNHYRKANWIASKMMKDTDVEDVLDVLLDNITEPTQFVAEVQMLSSDYDEEYEGHTAVLRRNNV